MNPSAATPDSQVPGNQAAATKQQLKIICALFFLSGFPALIYQLIWQRALFRILGVNIESVTIVVTAFMLGLGIGCIAGGRISKITWISLLPALAVIEVLTALFGLFSLNLFETVGNSVVGLPTPVTALVALALVVVPTLLMGATLPLLVGHFVRKSGDVGNSVGLLYFINTLGAAAACFFCIIVLFPNTGMKTSVMVAAALNFLISVGAILIYLHDRKLVPHASPQRNPASAIKSVKSNIPYVWILGLSAAGGFISLSYEIFFFRIISYATGSSPVAFAATLGCFLLGLAFGAYSAGKLCKGADLDTLKRSAFSALFIAAMLGIVFLPLSIELASAGNFYYVGTFFIVIGVSNYLGKLLPILAEIGIVANENVGMQTAKLYFSNIVGSTSGSIVTGFVLMEYLTSVQISISLSVATLLLALLFSILMFEKGIKRTAQQFSAAVAIALAVLFIPFASHNLFESLLFKNKEHAKYPFADVVENRSGIITATNANFVFGNGMYDGLFNVDPMIETNQVVRPFALGLMHANPENVLMIGLSSGSWGQIIAHNPMVEKLTIIEINPGYIDMIKKHPEIASLLTHPKVEIIIDDGRRWLHMNKDRKFDAVVSNTTYNFRANATNVLSTEFLTLLKTYLNPGGVVFYNTTDSARVQRTACTTFKHGMRFLGFMIGSDSPIDWKLNRWRDQLLTYKINGKPVFDFSQESNKAMLTKWRFMATKGLDKLNNTKDGTLESCENILRRTENEDIITDDNMGTEWRRLWDAFS